MHANTDPHTDSVSHPNPVAYAEPVGYAYTIRSLCHASLGYGRVVCG